MINTKHNNVYFKNQINGDIPRSGSIDPDTINPHDLCYQCYKHGPDCLFSKLSIRGLNDEPHFPEKIILISSQIQINTLFKTNDGRKIRICDRIIHRL